MRDHQPSIIYRKDYRPPDWLIVHTELRFELDESGSRVRARLQLRRNPQGNPAARDLLLDGHGLHLESLAIDDVPCAADAYQVSNDGLLLRNAPDQFELASSVLIHPEKNTALEGLYRSRTMFCTQCEAEGFRRITYFLDRPDVLCTFRTTVEADATRYPVLLSNGNDVERGESANGRHWVTWENPFPMPCYLFALVAGDLAQIDDSFTTVSGRTISLRIFTEPENIDRCDHAMDSLKRAMRWDEEVYGREYDLDIFMIVAVNDFNMGAMENKGLNIFNASCVLARPDTATDATFERIESIVAHEYFHNWSGNRVTCRDWFQLSLKEGFTVFRDQAFSADMGSPAVKRIADVGFLRTAQFAEDHGPLAHPVRPDSYMEIANFYTVTVYEKGAEVVRMLHALLGPEAFRRGTDLYFERYDGQAVTCDDFVQALEDASDQDLAQFRHWYAQSGTPRIIASGSYLPGEQAYELTLRQELPATPGQAAEQKKPQVIPVSMALLGADGAETHSEVLVLREPAQTWRFDGCAEAPVVSLLRGFSAPVKLEYSYTPAELAFLMAHDQDGFARWEAGQQLAAQVLQHWIDGRDADAEPGLQLWLSAAQDSLEQACSNASIDHAMLAQLLMIPSTAFLFEQQQEIDPQRVFAARERMLDCLAGSHEALLLRCYSELHSAEPYAYTAAQVGRRALRNLCLGLLLRTSNEAHVQLATQQFEGADNMTDRLAALQALVHSRWEQVAEAALQSFGTDWQGDELVLDMWRSVQAANPRPGALQRVSALIDNPGFDYGNPNRLRSVISVFCAQNTPHFHAPDGSGYQFLSAHVLRLDAQNPQIAARLLSVLSGWQRYEPSRRALMQAELELIAARPGLSRDVFDIASRALGTQAKLASG